MWKRLRLSRLSAVVRFGLDKWPSPVVRLSPLCNRGTTGQAGKPGRPGAGVIGFIDPCIVFPFRLGLPKSAFAAVKESDYLSLAVYSERRFRPCFDMRLIRARRSCPDVFFDSGHKRKVRVFGQDKTARGGTLEEYFAGLESAFRSRSESEECIRPGITVVDDFFECPAADPVEGERMIGKIRESGGSLACLGICPRRVMQDDRIKTGVS